MLNKVHCLTIYRIALAEKQYLDAFNDELHHFKVRVKDRARVRLEAAMKEVEEVRPQFSSDELIHFH